MGLGWDGCDGNLLFEPFGANNNIIIIMRRRESRMEFVCLINQDSVTISPNYSEAQGYILLSLIGRENIRIRLGVPLQNANFLISNVLINVF